MAGGTSQEWRVAQVRNGGWHKSGMAGGTSQEWRVAQVRNGGSSLRHPRRREATIWDLILQWSFGFQIKPMSEGGPDGPQE
jgi:hypothetical protein